MFAVPLGVCLSVAVAVLLLLAALVDVAVPEEAGVDVDPPHALRSKTTTTLRTARRSTVRLAKYFLTITAPSL